MVEISFVIPVYNRPEEVEELLHSFLGQDHKPTEIIIVDDGSVKICKPVAEAFSNKLNLKYFWIENRGQGFARNFGIEKSSSDYIVILDSDVILPKHYISSLVKGVEEKKLMLFGGPDAAHPDFNAVQRAVSFSMTSFITTGGIRGGKKQTGIFHPRSFNMGFHKDVFKGIGGFRLTRCGEDIDFSILAIQKGFKSGLIHDAFVYHKRRTSIYQFFRQVKFFGKARVNIFTLHKSELKAVHLLPSAYFLYLLFAIAAVVLSLGKLWYFLLPEALFIFLTFIESLIKNRSLRVALLSIATSHVQLLGYGIGFLFNFFDRIILGKGTIWSVTGAYDQPKI